MAATSKLYDVTEIRQGPGDLWIVGTAPVDATPRLTLVSGTPDSVAHAGSVCLGLTEGAITTTIKHKISDITVDQADAPVARYTEAVEMMIEAELTQQAIDKLQQAFTVGTYSTASGYKQMTVGGIGPVPSLCIAAIAPKKDDSTLMVVSVIFKATPVGGIQALMARGKKSTHKVQFSGLADLSRTAGKQIGIWYETIA